VKCIGLLLSCRCRCRVAAAAAAAAAAADDDDDDDDDDEVDDEVEVKDDVQLTELADFPVRPYSNCCQLTERVKAMF
jgi:hypothetical protein